MDEALKLTKYSHGSGCGCKVAPDVLKAILQNINTNQTYNNLLVGHLHADDAAVMRLNDELCLISTTDFFMPIVDDAFNYGAIAATNALSDVYAMGGKPVLAIAILGWPVDTLSTATATEVLNGAIHICNEAGVPLAGGHTIDNKEPFFGLAVNGIVHPMHLKQNHTVQEGDDIYLTKPLGTGIINTALKRGLAPVESIAEVITSMKKLNSFGVEISSFPFIHAITDVTGFGLLGHLREMLKPLNYSADVYYNKLHFFTGIKELAAKLIYSDNVMRNWKSCADETENINAESLITLNDPQTSGGLMIAVDSKYHAEFQQLLIAHRLTDFSTPIAKVLRRNNKMFTIHYD